SQETITAPPACRAISPVSSVTVWLPYWKLLVTFATWVSLMTLSMDRPGPLSRSGGRARRGQKRAAAHHCAAAEFGFIGAGRVSRSGPCSAPGPCDAGSRAGCGGG